MQLRDLQNKHAGEAVWVTGSGPSLDRVGAGEITGPRIYLNRTAFSLPWSAGETYWLVIDDAWGQGTPGPWTDTLEAVKSGALGGVGVFRDPLLPPRDDGSCFTQGGANIVNWTTPPSKQLPRDQVLQLDAATLAARGWLYARAGTAAPAIHLAWLMGASRVILAGVDGTDGYAGHVRHWYRQTRRGGFGYGQAREDALNAAAALGMPIEDRSALELSP
jgi:hypothetical protein